MPNKVRASSSSRANPHRKALQIVRRSGFPFVVGGAFALFHYTGIERDTKDLDLFVPPGAAQDVLRVLSKAGFHTRTEAAHWLGKAFRDEYMVDIIYGSGNWAVPVDQSWIDRGEPGILLGEKVPVAPVEEMIWTKSYVAHRERYDGADVLHLLYAGHEKIDWQHLLSRFGAHWELLLVYLQLFRFVYPSDTERIPTWVMADLLERARSALSAPPLEEKMCRGTLLDRYQFLWDIDRLGYHDAREEFALATGYTAGDVAADRRIAADMLQRNLVRPSRAA